MEQTSSIIITTTWLIVEWKRRIGGYGLITQQDLVQDTGDLHTGKQVLANIRGSQRKANIVMVSNDKDFIQKEFTQLTGSDTNQQEQLPEPSEEVYSDEAEYFGSNSDWGSSYHPTEDSDSDKRYAKKRLARKRKSESHKVRRERKSSKKNESYYKEEEDRTMDLNGYSEDVYAFNPLAKSPAVVPPYQSITNYQQCSKNNPPMTFDQQTQTAIEFCHSLDLKRVDILHSNQEALRMEMNQMQASVGMLKLKMDSMLKTIDDVKFLLHEKFANQNVESLADYHNNDSMVHNDSVLGDNSNILKDSSNIERNHIRYSVPESSTSNSPVQDIKIEECSDMVPIGSGKTLIPRHIYTQIQWSSYTQATRKLLMAIFPRKTLATHSLTGKSSPAFKMPAKMQLDPKKVSDIIITVSQLCRVPESLVRSIITIKCSDENKMYKIRLQKNKLKVKRSNKWNQENSMDCEDEDINELTNDDNE